MFRFRLRKSPTELALIAIYHGASIAGICLAALPAWLTLCGVSAVAANACRCWRHWQGQTVRVMVLNGGGALLIGAGEAVPYLPPRVVYRSEFLVLLRFRAAMSGSSRRHQSLLVFPDSLCQEQWRRLHRLLRFDFMSPAGHS